MTEPQMNTAPADFNTETDLPTGFMDLILPLKKQEHGPASDLLS